MGSEQLSIRTFLSGQSIGITGGSGFLGKTLIEKLLRYSSDTKSISVFLRAKTHQDARNRLQSEILESSVFRPFRSWAWEDYLSACEKINAFSFEKAFSKGFGDPWKNLTVMIHCAALVDFYSSLEEALEANFYPVQRLTEALFNNKHLRLVHVSTAYVCGNKSGTHSEAVKDRERLEAVQKEILNFTFEQKMDKSFAHNFAQKHGFVDIYTLTKWMAEAHMAIQSQELQKRICIVRPSIIESALKEPFPGWLEGLKVADPLILMAGSQRVQFFPGSPKNIIDLVPVDTVVNGILLAAAELFFNPTPLRVYHSTTSDHNPLTLENLYFSSHRVFKNSRTKFHARLFFLPLPLVQISLRLLSFGLLKMKKIFPASAPLRATLRGMLKMVTLYGSYATLNATFSSKGLSEIFEKLSDEEKQRFPISMPKDSWREYLERVHIPNLIQNVRMHGDKVMEIILKKKAK